MSEKVKKSSSTELVPSPRPEELAERDSLDMKVRLLYQRIGEKVLINIFDKPTSTETQFSVPPDKALEAFYHPYAYAPSRVAEAA